MKKNNFVYLLFGIFLLLGHTYAQDNSDLNYLIGKNLDQAQAELKTKGFEIAASSLFGKNQLWWNETEKRCVTIYFDKSDSHLITKITPGDANKCTSGVEAARKVWEKYHDGQAPATATNIEAEREKLRAKGYVVSYWIQDAAPGRSIEYWKGPDGKCMHIAWNSADFGDIVVDSCDSQSATNPAPKK